MSVLKGVAFNNFDPRELPAYTPTEAAGYLRVPLSTLRTWVYGYTPQPKSSVKRIPAIIRVPSTQSYLLSFYNLVEAHVLSSIRREHAIPLAKVRLAVKYVEDKSGVARPLANQRFETDGADLFIRSLGDLINVSSGGQVAFEKLLRVYLKRIEWDGKGLASRLFPYVRHGVPDVEQSRSILMDATISGGRPVLAGTGIATRVVSERFMAGESAEDLAADYGRQLADIHEAIRFEHRPAA